MIVRDFDSEDIDDDEDWDDDETTMPCPHCREMVYDDAELCPHCGLYLSREDAPYRKPWWVVAGVVACLAMVTWWILHP
jgi:zinc-ribbon domain